MGNTPSPSYEPTEFPTYEATYTPTYLPTVQLTYAPTVDVLTNAPTVDMLTYAPTEEMLTIAPTEEMFTFAPSEEMLTYAPTEEMLTYAPTEEMLTYAPTEEMLSYAPTEEMMTYAPTEEMWTTAPSEEMAYYSYAPIEEMTYAPTEELAIERSVARRKMIGVNSGYVIRQNFKDAVCSPDQLKGLSVYTLGRCVPLEEKSFKLTNYIKDAPGAAGYSVDVTLFSDKACSTVESTHQRKHPKTCEASEVWTYTTDMKLAYSDSYFSFSLPEEAAKYNLRASIARSNK